MVFFVEIPLSSPAMGGDMAGALSLSVRGGAAGQRGGPEQCASLADLALTCPPVFPGWEVLPRE